MKPVDQFNRIAPYYDALKTLMFAGRADAAEIAFLGRIPPASDVLIIGGGSGKVLRRLLANNPSCRVCYVESSSTMIYRAKKALAKGMHPAVTFIHGTEAAIPDSIGADVVITNFFLDVFPEREIQAKAARIDRHLRNQGIWLATDFVDTSWWHRGLLQLMYAFFRLVADLRTVALPSWERALRETGLVQLDVREFYCGFIRSLLLEKKVSE